MKRHLAFIVGALGVCALAACSSKTSMPYGGDAGALYEDRDFRAYDGETVLNRYQQVFRDAGYEVTEWLVGPDPEGGRSGRIIVRKDYEVMDGQWETAQSVEQDERGGQTINVDRSFTPNGFTLNPTVTGTISLALTSRDRVKSVSYDLRAEPQKAISHPAVGSTGDGATPAREFRDLVWSVLGPMATGDAPRNDG